MNRRTFTKSFAATVAILGLPDEAFGAPAQKKIMKPIRSTGELIPAIGMGTWQTFNVGADENLRRSRLKVLEAFLQNGGGLVDSSPMYGSAQEVIGFCLGALKDDEKSDLFSADKIWTRNGDETLSDLKRTKTKWNVERFDLMQVHNLLAWEDHLKVLFRLKAKKKIRYVGITTSHGRRHDDLAKIMKTQPIDFVQLTYNMVDRDVERTLLPLAAERGIAVIANRPMDGGALIDRLNDSKKPVPKFAKELDCDNWAQFILKWVVSHPAITVAIPATSRVDHMRENMGACFGKLPDAKTRARMLAHLDTI